jgi:hypothetical protein
MNYSQKIAQAIQHFWSTRQKQGENKGSNRSAVTGGAQLDGFINLCATILRNSGLSDHEIFTRRTILPGYFRPTKDWDLVVVADGELLAAIELKSHIGPSFGNNFNNRVEEAIGSATDVLTAYRAGAFPLSQKPWLGWLMLLEDTDKSQSSVKVKEPHFEVFEEFKAASYTQRYELFCQRLVREQLYDATCLILTRQSEGLQGQYQEPNPEINFKHFATSLSARARAFVEMRS